MSNFIKTTVLMVVLTVLFVWLGGALGGREGAVTACVFAAAMVIRMTISRVREFAADEGGAEISGRPDGLAEALIKISGAGRKGNLQRLNSAHSHLFIVNPLRGTRGLAKLFASHPPMEERVAKLRAMDVEAA